MCVFHVYNKEANWHWMAVSTYDHGFTDSTEHSKHQSHYCDKLMLNPDYSFYTMLDHHHILLISHLLH